ncbi:Ubiquinone/menaquinone biosynthesis C-methylase UbiE [Rhizobium sp. AN5]|uniref:class I SAM-dependent methyltransferase n=1 Tax=Rhizobium sp. AN5 TaxID=1855304 RepID=UPI000BDCC389|nr:class I SAM-dependent methyltransferase [Rhizobium sp. AN5]SOC90550.1 Ubiquinone/menaquinone biosynthesis C-methylase UbiE [Rhizobium sp. AN5]
MAQINVSSLPVFNRDASGYDVLRRSLIPCFDAFYGTALDLIDDWRDAEKLRVLDLGAGTGLFTAMLLTRHPDAQIHLVDASEKMLEQARQRFDGNPAITYAVADMSDAELGGPWDLIISALAIHHLEDASKKHLFGEIRSALSEGGLFVNAEQVLSHDCEVEARYARIWLQQVRRLGVSEAEIAKALERMSHDRCSPIENQLQWMHDTGFSEVDCSFKAWRFAVLSGRR